MTYCDHNFIYMCTINTSLSCTSQVWEMCCVLKWVWNNTIFLLQSKYLKNQGIPDYSKYLHGSFLIFTLLFHLNAYGIISVIDHDAAAHLIICKGEIPHISKAVLQESCVWVQQTSLSKPSMFPDPWIFHKTLVSQNSCYDCQLKLFFNQHLVFMATLLKATCQQHIRSSCSVYIGSNHLCDCCALKSIKVFVTLHKPNTQNRSGRI